VCLRLIADLQLYELLFCILTSLLINRFVSVSTLEAQTLKRLTTTILGSRWWLLLFWKFVFRFVSWHAFLFWWLLFINTSQYFLVCVYHIQHHTHMHTHAREHKQLRIVALYYGLVNCFLHLFDKIVLFTSLSCGCFLSIFLCLKMRLKCKEYYDDIFL